MLTHPLFETKRLQELETERVVRFGNCVVGLNDRVRMGGQRRHRMHRRLLQQIYHLHRAGQ
jgi:hypothetical protein